jgi:hypothetical protein
MQSKLFRFHIETKRNFSLKNAFVSISLTSLIIILARGPPTVFILFYFILFFKQKSAALSSATLPPWSWSPSTT